MVIFHYLPDLISLAPMQSARSININMEAKVSTAKPSSDPPPARRGKNRNSEPHSTKKKVQSACKIARRDVNHGRLRRRQEQEQDEQQQQQQQQQHHAFIEGARGKGSVLTTSNGCTATISADSSSASSSAVSSFFPALIPPAQQRVYPGNSAGVDAPLRQLWQTASGAANRSSPLTSSPQSSSSSALPSKTAHPTSYPLCSPPRPQYYQQHQEEQFSSDRGSASSSMAEVRNGDRGRQESSTSLARAVADVEFVAPSPPEVSSADMMETYLAELSSQQHFEDDGEGFADHHFSWPYRSCASTGKDEERAIYRGVDDLLARPSPSFDEAIACTNGVGGVSGGVSNGPGVWSSRDRCWVSSEGDPRLLRRGGCAGGSLPDVLLGGTRTRLSADVENKGETRGDTNGVTVKLQGRGTSATAGTVEGKSATCAKDARSNSGSSGSSLSSGVGGGRDTRRDSASRRPRRTRHQDRPTRSQSGYARRNSSTVIQRTGSCSDRHSQPNDVTAGSGTMQDKKIASLGGIDMTLLAEAFAYADQVAREEGNEADAGDNHSKKPSRRGQQYIKRNEREGGTLANGIGPHHDEHHPSHPNSSSSTVTGLRRTQSMGAASAITNTMGASSSARCNGGPAGERRRRDAAASAMPVTLGSKYDTDSMHSTRGTENWLTGSMGETEKPSLYSGAAPYGHSFGHRRSVGGGIDRPNNNLLKMENDFLVTPRTKPEKGRRRTRKQGVVVAATKQDIFRHHHTGGSHDRKNLEEISVRSPPEKNGNMNRSNGESSGREGEKEANVTTTAQLVEHFQRGAGIAELRAELENSQASMRRSAEAIKQAASRWHGPSAFP